VLKNVEDINQCMLTTSDVVRHSLVSRIIEAYDKYDNDRKKPVKR